MPSFLADISRIATEAKTVSSTWGISCPLCIRSRTFTSNRRPSVPPGWNCAKSCFLEPALFEQRDGQGIAHCERRGRARRRRESHGARLFCDGHIQRDRAVLGQGRTHAADDRHDRNTHALHEGQELQNFLRLSAVRNRNEDIADAPTCRGRRGALRPDEEKTTVSRCSPSWRRSSARSTRICPCPRRRLCPCTDRAGPRPP